MSEDKKPTWAPILTGADAEQARAVALELVRDLGHAALDEPSVTGEGGLALLFHYAELVFPGQGFDQQCGERLARVADLVAAGVPSPALFGGFTGAAWCMEHIEPTAVDASSEDDPLSDVDDALCELLATERWDGDYDLIRGLVGFAVYALERGARPRARECQRLIVDHLAKLAHPLPGGAAWWSPPIDLPKNPIPGGYNLGVAHGAPGAIAVLARLAVVPELADRARPLLDAAVSFLLSQRLASGGGAAFGNIADHPRPARSAWCYGDPGIAPVLLAAGRLARVPAWQQAAIEIGVAAAARPFADTLAYDPGICHGQAGLAHLYGRLYQGTGEGAFADAARWWLASTLAMRRPGEGRSGFLSLVPDIGTGDLMLAPDPSFLTGTAGIALVLMAAVSEVEPCWDRCLLAAIPSSS
jgi:hypothetical protein